jgi:hypothetical protein
MVLCLRTINTTGTEKSLWSENRFSRYLKGTALVLATEFLAAVRCGFLSVAEAADLTQIHSFLQMADCQNQGCSSRLQLRECNPETCFLFSHQRSALRAIAVVIVCG